MFGKGLFLFLFFTTRTNANDDLPTFRLKNDVRPVHYELLLDMYIPDREYMGTVDITLVSGEVHTTARTIEINSNGLNLNNYKISLKKENEIVKIGAIIEQNCMEKIIFVLTEDLVANANYKLHIEFTGHLSISNEVGLLIKSYTDENNETREYIVASMFPIYARNVFPCFDEPSLKATFNLTLGHSPELTSLSTMPILSSSYGINVKGEKIIWQIFQETAKITPSSLGIVISRMESDTKNDINIWATSRNEAEKILQLPHFENFHNSFKSLTSATFPLASLNFVFLPELHIEAFESFGIIYIRSNELAENLNVESVSGSIVSNVIRHSKSMLVEVAKQVAAQYFGNIVSPTWWTDIWLRESLSQFYGLFMASKLDKDLSDKLIPSIMRNQVLEESYDDKGSLRIIGEDFNSSSELVKSLSRSRINKGVSLLFMLLDALGQNIFFEGLSSFLKNFSLSSATTHDLIQEWENQVKSSNVVFNNNFTLDHILKPWIESEDVPVLNIQRKEELVYSTLIISQYGYSNMTHPTEWYIPFRFTSAREKNYSATGVVQWLGPHTVDGRIIHTMTIQNASGVNDWILFNLGGTGLFRVSYDSTNWKLLIHQLQKNSSEIPSIERAQLIADVFSLASNGRGTYSNALQLAEYLVNETSFLPWHAAYEAFEKLDKQLYQNKTLYKKFKVYVKTLVEVIYTQLGFVSDSGNTPTKENYLDILLRAETMRWACKYDIGNCNEMAISLVNHFLAGNNSIIQDEYKETIFCGGLSNANTHTWNETYNVIRTSKEKGTKKSILLGLGCSKDPNLIDSYLNAIFSDDMNAEDALYGFYGVYKKEYNFERALDFFSTNIDIIQKRIKPALPVGLVWDQGQAYLQKKKAKIARVQDEKFRYGNETLNTIILDIGRHATTTEQVEKLMNISKKIDTSDASSLALNHTLKQVQASINWIIINENNFNSYFIGNTATTMRSESSLSSTTENYSVAIRNVGNIFLLDCLVLYLII